MHGNLNEYACFDDLCFVNIEFYSTNRKLDISDIRRQFSHTSIRLMYSFIVCLFCAEKHSYGSTMSIVGYFR